MADDRSGSPQKLSKVSFFIAANGILGNIPLCRWINMLEEKVTVDIDGNLPSDIIGALYLMVHSSLGTAYVHPSQRAAVRKLKSFLDPYLEDRYRPEMDEPPPAIYLGG